MTTLTFWFWSHAFQYFYNKNYLLHSYPILQLYSMAQPGWKPIWVWLVCLITLCIHVSCTRCYSVNGRGRQRSDVYGHLYFYNNILVLLGTTNTTKKIRDNTKVSIRRLGSDLSSGLLLNGNRRPDWLRWNEGIWLVLGREWRWVNKLGKGNRAGDWSLRGKEDIWLVLEREWRQLIGPCQTATGPFFSRL